jgi:endogenous inhibitor of DNA gyrase (YacG/DUF329 family)
MSNTAPRQVACPQCGKLSLWSVDNAYRPFCCERCKLIDLGAWAQEQYKIAGDPVDENNDPEADR